MKTIEDLKRVISLGKPLHVIEKFAEKIGPEAQPLVDEYKKQQTKTDGIVFEGVKCSATKDDQNGITAITVLLQARQNDHHNMHFSNGSVLRLDKNNISDFLETWVPFRSSFFEALE